jgi:hypothetical protein
VDTAYTSVTLCNSQCSSGFGGGGVLFSLAGCLDTKLLHFYCHWVAYNGYSLQWAKPMCNHHNSPDTCSGKLDTGIVWWFGIPSQLKLQLSHHDFDRSCVCISSHQILQRALVSGRLQAAQRSTAWHHTPHASMKKGQQTPPAPYLNPNCKHVIVHLGTGDLLGDRSMGCSPLMRLEMLPPRHSDGLLASL